MNKLKAMELVMQRHMNRRLLNILLAWDESNTVDENADACKISHDYARRITSNYRLRFRKSPFNFRRAYTRVKSDRYIKKWRPDLTIKENAKNLGVTKSAASNIANAYGLSWTKHYKSGMSAKWKAKSRKFDLRMQMKSMRDAGVTLEKIGKAYGITRERVRQIVL